MVDDAHTVPVWTLTTTETSQVSALWDDQTMTPERLVGLRSALSTFVDAPIVTLEAHPLPSGLDRSRGVQLDAMSPLAQELARLVSNTSKTAPAVLGTQNNGEVLYRMVVPAKVAAQIGKGLVKPMQAKGVPGAIHGAMVHSSGARIASNVAFVPVKAAAAGSAATAASAGAAGGAAGTAAVAATGAAALTVAAPLVLMAVAVAVTAHADHKRQQAIENITELLEKLHSNALDQERRELNGCRDAIDKATSILLDQGKIGASLGLDSAVHEINTAIATADDRTAKWEKTLDALGDQPINIERLTKAFPGIDGPGGEFRVHLELAGLAVALKRRVIVLQAVDHSQADAGNPFDNFVRMLKSDQRRVDELEARVASVLLRLSTLQLRAPAGVMDRFMSRGEVDELMRTAYRLRAFGEGIRPGPPAADVAIEIAKEADGSIRVLPPVAS